MAISTRRVSRALAAGVAASLGAAGLALAHVDDGVPPVRVYASGNTVGGGSVPFVVTEGAAEASTTTTVTTVAPPAGPRPRPSVTTPSLPPVVPPVSTTLPHRPNATAPARGTIYTIDNPPPMFNPVEDASVPLSTVTGSVRAALGLPVAGTCVTSYNTYLREDGTPFSPAVTVHTNALGAFTFKVPYGVYRVEVRDCRVLALSPTGHAPTWMHLGMAPRQDGVIDFVVGVGAGVRVQVTTTTTPPPGGWCVSVIDDNTQYPDYGGPYAEGRTDAQGQVTITRTSQGKNTVIITRECGFMAWNGAANRVDVQLRAGEITDVEVGPSQI